MFFLFLTIKIIYCLYDTENRERIQEQIVNLVPMKNTTKKNSIVTNLS